MWSRKLSDTNNLTTLNNYVDNAERTNYVGLWILIKKHTNKTNKEISNHGLWDKTDRAERTGGRVLGSLHGHRVSILLCFRVIRMCKLIKYVSLSASGPYVHVPHTQKLLVLCSKNKGPLSTRGCLFLGTSFGTGCCLP